MPHDYQNDVLIDPELSVVQAVIDMKQEAEWARRERIKMSRRNRDAFHGRQDWSHKQRGQSREFLPKTASAIEQFSAFIKRGLTQFGDWFTVDMPDGSPITGNEIRSILMGFFDNLPDTGNKNKPLSHLLSDAAKVALLESMIILKVHGRKHNEKQYFAESGDRLVRKKGNNWRLHIDLLPPEDYFPDPTGRGLYEIHRVERDLYDVKAMAKAGIYDEEAVAMIELDFLRSDMEAMDRKRERKEDRSESPRFRKRVVIDEFWGTLLDSDGDVWKENCVCAIANDKFLIREPEDNPFWHGESPFVAGPLMRVPFTVWNRALFDQVVPINEAMNEMFNLMLDGGLASVWGIKQVRTSWMEDPAQVAEGISQGMAVAVNEMCPENGKVIENVTEGEVPPDALAMYNLLDKEFNASALTNDIKLGLLPSKQVKATEIVEASQSQAVTLDAIISDFEYYITNLIKKSWLTILQNADDLRVKDLDTAAGRRTTLMLARMSKAQRFETLGSLAGFKVHGLSATLTRARDFQRMMAVLQVVSQSPMLARAFHTRFSEDKVMLQLIKQLNINPERIERDPQEQKQIAAEMKDAASIAQSGALGGPNQRAQGEAGMQSEINQEAQPSGGI